jgi:hypothetical protein
VTTYRQPSRLKSRRGTIGEIPPVPTVHVVASGTSSATASWSVLWPHPIQPSRNYHLIRLTSTTGKIADTWADKEAGTAIDLTTDTAVKHQGYTTVEFQTSTNGTTWTTRSGSSYTLTGLAGGTTVYARARSYNGTNYSEYGTDNATTEAELPDTTDPAIPTGLAASASSPTQVIVSWNDSADVEVAGAFTSGIASYKLYRNGGLRATIPYDDEETPSYTDTTVANTQYSYRVSAVDVAGNESAQATAVTLTTPSTEPTPGTVVFQDDFEAGGINGTRWNTSVDGVTAPTNVSYFGTRRMKFEVQRALGGANHRCELRAKIPGWDDGSPIKGAEIWIGARIRLGVNRQGNGYVSNGIGNTILQLHKSNNGSTSTGNPMIVLRIVDGNWRLVTRSANFNGGNTTRIDEILAPTQTDVDINFVFFFKQDWVHLGSSVAENMAWVNGTQILDLPGRGNAYEDYANGTTTQRRGYWKCGLYIPDYQGSTGPDRVLYYDQFRVARDDGSFATVTPGWDVP